MFRRSPLLAGVLAGIVLLAPASAPAQESGEVMEKAVSAMEHGDFQQAAEGLRRVLAEDPDNGIAWFYLGYSLHALGRLEEAHDCHVKAQDEPSVRPVAIYNHACVHALWGEKETALRLLEDAVAEGFDDPETLREDEDLATLREDPRFRALVRSLGGGEEDEEGEEETGEAEEIAEAEPLPPPAPAEPVEQAHAFDFYPGEWELLAGDRVVGRIHVERLFGGAVFEARSENSRSFFRFDPVAGEWHQVWAGAGGRSAELHGRLENGAIRLTTRDPIDDAGRLGRATYRNFHPDAFDYLFETSADGGRSWQRASEVKFRRAERPHADARLPRAEGGPPHLREIAAPPEPPAPVAPPEPPAAEAPADAAAHAYDFKLGSWTIEGRIRTSDGGSLPCHGKSIAIRREDGVLVEEIVIQVQDGPTYVGRAERRFDRQTGRWLVSWRLTEPEPAEMELIGKLKDGGPVEYGGDGEDATGSFSNRITFLDIGPDSYSARQDRLYDDGRLEVGVWMYRARRAD
ncbi:MAG: hypothetical protein D6702_02110 [Planctomycetota bacterium]|nr:MAG: hypothetical protein D6702_02110 [Planctomycetota bacterium]